MPEEGGGVKGGEGRGYTIVKEREYVLIGCWEVVVGVWVGDGHGVFVVG
jgi:hypothetical protein